MARPRASMTRDEYLARAAKAIPESRLQEEVRSLCKTFGHKHYHTHDSRRSENGFPDSVIVAKRRLIVVEHKREGKYPTEDQEAWLQALADCQCQACGAPAVTVRVWRPSDLLRGDILELLRP